MNTAANLSQLPKPSVIEALDYEALYAARVNAFVALYPTEQQAAWREALALESDPVAKLLQENVYREMIMRARINDAARATMLAFAKGADLDHIGAGRQTPRKLLRAADNSTTPPTPAVWEDDERYRERIQLAYESLSVAGPSQAYLWHVLAAHPDILHASVLSPSPAHVSIYLLSRNGNGAASAAEIAAVESALEDNRKVRPLSDRVSVQSAAIIDYSISAKLYTYPRPEIEPIMKAARANVDKLIRDQRRVGRDITLSAIYSALHVEGVQRVQLLSPTADVVITNEQSSHCTSVTVTHGGTDV